MNPRIACIALCLFLSGPAFAQSCSFKENTTDKFTGKKHRLTDKMTIARHVKGKGDLKIPEFYFVFKQEGDTYALQLGYKTNKSPVMMTVGDKLILLLSNKEQIEVPITSYIPSTASSGLKIDYSYWFDISAADLEKMKANKVTDIRVVATVNPIDINVDDNAGAEVMAMAGCMLSE